MASIVQYQVISTKAEVRPQTLLQVQSEDELKLFSLHLKS